MTENNNVYCDTHVVGIALVVEEIAKGCKLVFKYPLHQQHQLQPHQQYDGPESKRTTKNATTSTSSNGMFHTTKNNYHAHTTRSSANHTNNDHPYVLEDDNNKNIFFRLEPRILAKLFRTKPALCDQPVSLNIEGTLFCCRSVLLDPELYQQQQQVQEQKQQQQQQQQHQHQQEQSKVKEEDQDEDREQDKEQEGRQLQEEEKEEQVHHNDDALSVHSNYSKQVVVGSPNTLNTSGSGGTAVTTTAATTTTTTTATGGLPATDTSNGLVLFSIIVAMKPTYIETTSHALHHHYFSSNYNENYFIYGNNIDSDDNIELVEFDFHDNHNTIEPSSDPNDYSNSNKHKQKFRVDDKKQQQQKNRRKQKERRKSITNYTLLDNRMNENVSLHFPAVRRIHLTLSRFCKVLEREEKRCLYVSRQVRHLIQIADEGSGAGAGSGNAATSTTSGRGGDGSGDGSPTKKIDNGMNQETNYQQHESSSRSSLNPLQNKNIGSGTAADNIVQVGNDWNDIDDTPSAMIMNGNIIEDALMMYNNNNNNRNSTPHNNQKSMTPRNLENNASKTISNILNDHDHQQKRIDSMLAASPPPTRTYSEGGMNDEEMMKSCYKDCIPIYGNLALELTQIYQALSRNSHGLQPSPDSLLSGRDGIVYVNHHIAVKVEPAKASRSNLPGGVQSSNSKFLRPYHTLLFHPIGATELLRHKLSKSFTREGHDGKARRHVDLILRQMEKLLLVADDPFKSLHDMASDAALPLQNIIESAISLLEAGVCIALPAMTPLTRFGCSRRSVERMASLKLEFAQQFGFHLPIYLVVSALTTVCPTYKVNSNNDRGQQKSLIRIGELIEYSKIIMMSFHDADDDDDDDDDLEGENASSTSSTTDALKGVPPIIVSLTHRLFSTLRSERIPPGFRRAESRYYDVNANSANPSKVLENAIISMTTWLRSRSIIVEQKEYLASIRSKKAVDFMAKKPPAKSVEHNFNTTIQYYELFYREFVSDKYIACGNVSTRALAWKFNRKLAFIEGFRDWGVKEGLLTTSTRIPTRYDDWGAP